MTLGDGPKMLPIWVKHINGFCKPIESRQTYPILKYCQQMSLRSENKDLQKSEKVLTEALR